jgi:hypothetical protein
MPIVFVHGVSVRETDPDYEASWQQLQRMLREWIAPVIAPDPQNVAISMAYWGDAGAYFAWNGASFPWRTPGSGPPPVAPPPEPVAPPVSGAARTVTAVLPPLPEPGESAPAASPASMPAELGPPDSAGAPPFWQTLLARRAPGAGSDAGAITAPNPAAWLANMGDYLETVVSGTARLSGAMTGRMLVEVRKSLANLVTVFFADVFTYLVYRGTAAAPGPIPARVLDTLAVAARNARERGGEPLIVLSHSMGGQVIYDIVTGFLPSIPWYGDIRIDFWCATASQVGLFEELKLFLASRPAYGAAQGNRVPFPDRRYLGGWWNVWNPNDFLSYPAAAIIEDVDDEAYASGVFATRAHDGYLRQTGFFQAFAEKVRAAQARDWDKHAAERQQAPNEP